MAEIANRAESMIKIRDHIIGNFLEQISGVEGVAGVYKEAVALGDSQLAAAMKAAVDDG